MSRATAGAHERGMMFSPQGVRAILDGRKTQTRRVMRPQPIEVESLFLGSRIRVLEVKRKGGQVRRASRRAIAMECPHGSVGGLLWVREAWYPAFRRTETNAGVIYLADGRDFQSPGDRKYHGWGRETVKWGNPMFMPRWASRLVLEITEVRVERVQEITDEGCEAEGVRPSMDGDASDWRDDENGWHRTFRQAWDALNAGRGFGWDVNPWVWAITFRRVEAER